MSPKNPPQRSSGEVKAELKAAKAYAKAQRPWYKKKRFIALGLFALLVVISVATDGGGHSTTTAPDRATAPAVNRDAPVRPDCTNRATDNCTPEVASTRAVRVDALTWSIIGTRTATTLGDPELGGAKADDVFLIVALKVHSNKNESATITDDVVKLESSEGNSYSVDSDGTIAAIGSGDDPLFLKDIGPDQTTTSKVVFDVPQRVLDAGAKLRFNELGFGSTHGYIRLAST